MMDNPILNQYQVQSEGGNLLNQDDDISHRKPCSLVSFLQSSARVSSLVQVLELKENG